jgi:hypothetical protein
MIVPLCTAPVMHSIVRYFATGWLYDRAHVANHQQRLNHP